jgi:serine/threonine-protein kinase HipA
MTKEFVSPYQPTDLLYLWWLGTPAEPRLVGELATVRALQGVSLRYAPSWLGAGFALSEDMPLTPGLWLPAQKETAAGAVDDARPDRWGERVIRVLDKPARLSLMEYLYFAGDERFGALGVSTSSERYAARQQGPLPELADVAQVARLVQQVQAGEAVAPELRRLVAPGASMGGARPKALMNLEGQAWVLKFSEPGDWVDVPLVEHAAMRLAARAGIQVADTRPIALGASPAGIPARHALAVRRFDRAAGRRVHALSAKVVLQAAGDSLGYPELAQVLRRRGVAGSTQAKTASRADTAVSSSSANAAAKTNVSNAITVTTGRLQMQELFRRMVFNILLDNTDDHEKNHALLVNEHGEYMLSPAYDVLPTGQALGYQQMRVGQDAADATLTNALSEHSQFGLKRSEAEAQVRQVVAVADQWKQRFAAAGVRAQDIESLAQQIDRPFLADQRLAWRTNTQRRPKA